MKPAHSLTLRKGTKPAGRARFARRALPAAITLVFAHAAWADAITINAGGNAAQLPVAGVANSASVTSATATADALSITVSGRAVIDWASFNIGASKTV